MLGLSTCVLILCGIIQIMVSHTMLVIQCNEFVCLRLTDNSAIFHEGMEVLKNGLDEFGALLSMSR